MSLASFDPRPILATLDRHGVRYVLIGGLAARLWGSPTITSDADLCYARDADNLERLARALTELGAKLRGVAEEVPFKVDAHTLAMGDSFTFSTRLGDLDCLGTPSGSGGFDDLVKTAVPQDLGGLTVLVASLDDLMRMKAAAGRPKDRIELEVLGALRDRLEGRDG